MATLRRALAAGVAASIGLAGCTASTTTKPTRQPSTSTPRHATSPGSTSLAVPASYNAANAGIVNASKHSGGVVKFSQAGYPDSLDPGNNYFVWNSDRLWSRALTMYRPLPGAAGRKLVPDLATSLGRVSDGGRTWAYTIRRGLRYSDGSPITSADVKYAVERSNYAPAVLSNGPTYLHELLVDNTPAYRGPYLDPNGDLKSIATPDATTIVFHLARPFADFDYLASIPQTAPVPKAKDSGAGYVEHIVSSGSYMFSSYQPTRSAVLVRNPYWSATTDPVRKQYASEIEIEFSRDQADLDQDLLAGNRTLDLAGQGVASATQAQLLTVPANKAHTDNVGSGALDFVVISPKVAPLTNIDCRIAVEYAIDKVSVQNALGGPLRGDIASTVLPPNIAGHRDFDAYPTPGRAGDLAKARSALSRCGHPNGFAVRLAVQGDQPTEVAAAVSMQASLARVDIVATIRKFPSGRYFSDYVGVPAFVHSHDIGLILQPWAADWPDGYAFLDQLVDGHAIRTAGNGNLAEIDDPMINAQLTQGISIIDPVAREKVWGAIDRELMAKAVFVPLVYRKDLIYRPPNATNVTVSGAFGYYDLLNVGTR